MIVVTIVDEEHFHVHIVDREQLVPPVDVTDQYEMRYFPVDDGDERHLVAGFHVGRRLPRAEVEVHP